MSGKSQFTGAGYAIWAAFALFLITSVGFPVAIVYRFGSEMHIEHKLTLAQMIVSLVGFSGAIIAFYFAYVQYRRSEQWKRTEFIAGEFKDFESDPVVQNALLMIDWGTRRINLFLRPDPEDADYVEITRDVQWRALLPHPLKKNYPAQKAENSPNESKYKEGQSGRFTVNEAKIRDTYDVFLTRLDRFANYINSGLISAEELEPFLSYWVDAITKNEHPTEDAAWRCTLLTYINFYGYTGVKYLFESYGKDVNPESPLFSDLRSSVQDKVLADSLYHMISPQQG
ncbi:MAG TPA: hypothetical protein VJ875_14020 [Pyrinomonadaceae bacterium]|nr:hypothetical protein [Pyrinomonadaceae bacterium]